MVEFFEGGNLEYHKQQNAKGANDMIRVRKISHASYETPDLDKQTQYYTDVLGLMLIAKEKKTVYLANTVDHHSIILRGGPESEMHSDRFSDRIRTMTSTRSRNKLRPRPAHMRRKKDAEPTIADMVVFEDPKGTVMEVFKRPNRRSRRSGPMASFPTSSATWHFT